MRKAVHEKSASQPASSEVSTELARVIPIRTETTLSRRPIHRLSKKGTIKIKEARKNERGQVVTTWEVRNAPGPLAYKVDKLVIDRRIDEARPNIPKLLKVGSLREICLELGFEDSGKNKANIKEALHQNASAYVIARLDYSGTNGGKRKFEFGSSRYAVYFVGEELPSGETADAIYVRFHDDYYGLLTHSQTRPLDYEYLKELPPAAQRVYELISFVIYGAIKHGRDFATFPYSELCLSAPLTRYHEWERAKKQLYKIHRPHIDSGYLKAVYFEETTDKDGIIDWLIKYTPGRKARHEFKEFTMRRDAQAVPSRTQPQLVITEVQAKEGVAETELVTRMRNELGITPGVGQVLEAAYGARCLEWCEAKKHSKDLAEKGAGYFVKAISEGWELPATYKTTKTKIAAREREKQNKREQEGREAYQEYFEDKYSSVFMARIEEIKANHADEWQKYEDATSKERDLLMGLVQNPTSRAGLSILIHFVCGHFTKGHPCHVPSFWEWDDGMNVERFDYRSAESRKRLRLPEVN
jgi:hypothetical protein